MSLTDENAKLAVILEQITGFLYTHMCACVHAYVCDSNYLFHSDKIRC